MQPLTQNFIIAITSASRLANDFQGLEAAFGGVVVV